MDAAHGPGYYTAEVIARGAEVAAFEMLELTRAQVGDGLRLERAVLGVEPLPADSMRALAVGLGAAAPRAGFHRDAPREGSVTATE